MENEKTKYLKAMFCISRLSVDTQPYVGLLPTFPKR